MSFFDAKHATVLALVLGGMPACALIAGVGELDVVAPPDAGEPPHDAGVDTAPTPKPDAAEASTDAPVTPVPPSLPLAGSYSYTAKGGDSLNGAFHFETTYGPNATVVVALDPKRPACFTQTITLRSGYEESMDECIVGYDVVQGSGVRAQSFPLVGTVTTELTCMPGDPYFGTIRTPNLEWTHSCEGKNKDDKSGDSTFVTAGKYRYMGEETIMIQGATVPVSHFHDERAVTGSQTGTNVADWYFASNGLLVRLVRAVSIQYKSIIGTITYSENADITLAAGPGTK